MKFLLLTALLVSSSVYSSELFTSAQKKQVLQTIDNVCGDTWCEGDYNFQFNSFSCEKQTSTCELNFQFIKTDDNGENPTLSTEQVCRFENIKTYKQLMENKWSLNDDFYSAVTDCIWEKEPAVTF